MYPVSHRRPITRRPYCIVDAASPEPSHGATVYNDGYTYADLNTRLTIPCREIELEDASIGEPLTAWQRAWQPLENTVGFIDLYLVARHIAAL